jgi:ParB family chromosome partitioning protein
MGKLQAEGAGWNAGKNYYAKTMKVEDIVVDPLISQVFMYKRQILDEVCRSIREKGYDKSQPIAIWKGANIVVDGHTRLAAAKEAGLSEVPVAEMEFADKEEAVLYTFERQVLRRNLTSAEILAAVELMPTGQSKKGAGRAAHNLAEKLGVSEAHLYQARKILKEAAPEDIEAVKAEKKTVKEVYNTLRKPKPKLESDMIPPVATYLDNLMSPIPAGEPDKPTVKSIPSDFMKEKAVMCEKLTEALRILQAEDRSNLDIWALISLIKDVLIYLDELAQPV